MDAVTKAFREADRAYFDHYPAFQAARVSYREKRIGHDEYLLIWREHKRLLAIWERAYTALEAQE